MHFLIKAAMLLAAGAAGWALAKRGKTQPEVNDQPQVVYLKDEEAVIDAEPASVAATVKTCFRRMDPLTLTGANEAVFLLADGTEVKLNFTGEGGLHIKPGDQGMLTWRGMRLIRFELENGDVIGGSFYAAAGEADHE